MLNNFQVLAEKVDAELRMHARRMASRSAKLRLRDGRFMACKLINVSPGGALFDVAAGEDLPEEFNLIISGAEFEAACEVRHRRRTDYGGATVARVGVMFMSNRLTALQRFG
jgi:hypothetical protein